VQAEDNLGKLHLSWPQRRLSASLGGTRLSGVTDAQTNGIARLRKILERADEGRGLPHAGATKCTPGKCMGEPDASLLGVVQLGLPPPLGLGIDLGGSRPGVVAWNRFSDWVRSLWAATPTDPCGLLRRPPASGLITSDKQVLASLSEIEGKGPRTAPPAAPLHLWGAAHTAIIARLFPRQAPPGYFRGRSALLQCHNGDGLPLA
jgi:hypothetical protein